MSRLELDVDAEGDHGQIASANTAGFTGKMAATVRSGKELGQSISMGIQKLKKNKKKKRKNTVCCGLLQKKRRKTNNGKEEDPRALRKYCQFCRCYMTASGDINNYYALFDGYQLDDEDKKQLTQIFANRTLCAKCYRPYKKFPNGASNRYQRWQVTIELLSFYVFIFTLFVPLLVVITLPALFQGLWSRIQDISDSSKHVTAKQSATADGTPSPRKSGESSYRSQIRKIIEEELTSESEEMLHKLNTILKNTDPDREGKDREEQDGNAANWDNEDDHGQQQKTMGGGNGGHGGGHSISNEQYSHLVAMINGLNAQLDALRNTVAASGGSGAASPSPSSPSRRKSRKRMASHSPHRGSGTSTERQY